MAASTVSTNGAKQEVKLFCSWFCPFAQRAWIAAEHKGIPYKYIEVDPYATPPELMAVNPRGLVPALEHGGKALYESMVLVEYIDEAFSSDKAPSLLPQDPYLRAVARIWADFVNKKVVPTFYRYLLRQDKTEQEEAGKEMLEHYKVLSQAMAEIHPQGPFFMGPEFSLVDITLVPWIARHDVLNFYRGFTVPDTPELTRFNQWAAAALEVPSFKATLQDKQKLIESYESYAKNTADSQVAQAMNQNKSLP